MAMHEELTREQVIGDLISATHEIQQDKRQRSNKEGNGVVGMAVVPK